MSGVVGPLRGWIYLMQTSTTVFIRSMFMLSRDCLGVDCPFLFHFMNSFESDEPFGFYFYSLLVPNGCSLYTRGIILQIISSSSPYPEDSVVPLKLDDQEGNRLLSLPQESFIIFLGKPL